MAKLDPPQLQYIYNLLTTIIVSKSCGTVPMHTWILVLKPKNCRHVAKLMLVMLDFIIFEFSPTQPSTLAPIKCNAWAW